MKRTNHRKPGHQLLVMILCAVLVFSSVPVYAFSPERLAEAASDHVYLPAVEADAADAAEQESVSEDAFSGGLTDILFGEPAAGEALAEEAAGEASGEAAGEAAAGEASQEENVEEEGQPGTAGGRDGYTEESEDGQQDFTDGETESAPEPDDEQQTESAGDPEDDRQEYADQQPEDGLESEDDRQEYADQQPEDDLESEDDQQEYTDQQPEDDPDSEDDQQEYANQPAESAEEAEGGQQEAGVSAGNSEEDSQTDPSQQPEEGNQEGLQEGQQPDAAPDSGDGEIISEDSVSEAVSEFAAKAGESGVINIDDFTLFPGKNLIEITDEQACLALFQPVSDDVYTFSSTGDNMTNAFLFTGEGVTVAEDMGTGTDDNFRISCELTGGTSYILYVIVSDGVPGDLQSIEVSAEKGLQAGSSIISVAGTGESVLKYVPEQSGDYTISSLGEAGYAGTLYDQNMGILKEDSGSGENRDFRIVHTLDAENVYYIGVRHLEDVVRSHPVLSVSTCTTHSPMEGYDTVKTPTCMTKGYTEHICEICGVLYRDTYVDAVDHYYGGGNVCLFCGAENPAPVNEPVSLSAAKVTVPAQTYTGKALKPNPTVVVDGVTLSAGTDYTVTYGNNVNAGTGKVTVKAVVRDDGTDKYKDSVTASFTIKPASIGKAVISNLSARTYNGSAQKPAPVVKVGSATLKSGTDYTVTYAGNTNAGTAAVTVSGKGNYTGTCKSSFTINKAASSLSFAKTSITKKATDSAFTNTLTKKTDGKVTFSSSNTSVAAVDASTGRVTVRKAGKATITAKAAAGRNYKAGSASYTLTVNAVTPVNYGIPGTLKLGVSQKYILRPTFNNAVFKTADSKIAVVSDKGVITAKKAGTTVIRVYRNNKVVANCKVTVLAAPSSVKAGVSKLTLGVSETYTLKPTIPNNSCTVFKYSSSNTRVATVSSGGVIKGVRTGRATVTVTTHNNKKASVAVTVVQAPSKVTISPASLTLGVSESRTLKPAIPSGSHTTFKYSSKDAKIASVSDKGVVKAVRTGKTTITVSTHNNKKASVTVTVMKAPSAVTLSVSKLSLGVGESYTLKPSIPSDSHTTFTYSSKDTKVASVSSGGAIKGVKVGKTTITVSTHNKKTAALTVTVMKAPSKITLNKTRLLMNKKGTFQLKATLPADSMSLITWKSSNTGVVTVDKNGKLTAKGDGTAKITASTFNKKSAACTVTVSDDFVFSGRTLIKYKGNKGTVTIPPVNTNGDTILSIGESAFEGNTTVTKVIIPDTVKTIGNKAFKDCTALQSVTLPASLTTIGEQAFCGDTSLKTLYIPHGTTTISPGAFAESSLEEIYLPDTVTSIDDSAFDGLPDLIFYAPYGSYAYEYAQEKDYQTENSGTGYREDQLQDQLKILEELESAGESEPAEPMEFEFLDDEGIEDEELLAFIADVNNTIQASRNSYYQYMQTAEGLSDAYDGLVDKAESLNIDVSDGNISLESDDISYTLGGDAIDVLGSDYTILSATADESQGVLRLEIESGGKKYNLVEDANGITVNEIGNSVGIAASDGYYSQCF